MGDLRCPSSTQGAAPERLISPLITLLIGIDYRKIIPVIPYRKYVSDEDLNGRYITISLFDYVIWSSRLWEHFTVLQLSIKVRQSGYP